MSCDYLLYGYCKTKYIFTTPTPPALVLDINEAGEGRGVFDVAAKEHLGVDGADLAREILVFSSHASGTGTIKRVDSYESLSFSTSLKSSYTPS